MALHTVESLTSLSKDKLVDATLAAPTRKTRGMIRIVAGHDSFVEDGEVAYFAVVAIRAYWRSIREQEEVCVRL